MRSGAPRYPAQRRRAVFFASSTTVGRSASRRPLSATMDLPSTSSLRRSDDGRPPGSGQVRVLDKSTAADEARGRQRRRFALNAHVQSVAAATSGGLGDPAVVRASAIFEPLSFRNLEVKNRIFRSSVAGRFDNYDGSGTEVRINWDVKFARGGVGAIISSNAPVDARGHIVPGYAYIDSDETIPFWRELGQRVHAFDCKYIVQLVFAGRERMMSGVRRWPAWSSSDRAEPVNGFPATRMTVAEIQSVVSSFAQATRRAREAGLDGGQLAGADGGLFNQFLS